jgi:hypothetical protein
LAEATPALDLYVRRRTPAKVAAFFDQLVKNKNRTGHFKLARETALETPLLTADLLWLDVGPVLFHGVPPGHGCPSRVMVNVREAWTTP